MDLNLIWQAILIVVVGTFLLRLAGRKTVSQMTLAEAILMISIGTLLIQPVTSKSVWVSFVIGAVLVATLLFMEYGQLKFDSLERLFTGKSKVVIENGILNEKEMAKLRLTVDQLEMNLRQNNVTSISDVEWATLEPSGQLGLTLKQEAQPATKKDIQQLQESINYLINNQAQLEQMTKQLSQANKEFDKDNIFTEVKNEGHKHQPPEHLQ
ncbi:MAG TPA: DUF421 domain-containing protein [Bacillota bacterium]|nr:DUF421 domain-containing protein [Bacillota bacterium]